MFEHFKDFIESKLPDTEKTYQTEEKEITKAKCDETLSLLENLTILADGLDGFKDTGESIDFRSYCKQIKAHSEDRENLRLDIKKSSPWLDDNLLTDVVKLMLSSEYSPPTDNITGMQIHLWTLTLYYLLSFDNLPEIVDMRLDLARSKLAFGAGLLSATALNKGIDLQRTKKSTEKYRSKTYKRREEIRNYCDKLDLEGRSRQGIAEILQNKLSVEWSIKTLVRDLKALNIP